MMTNPTIPHGTMKVSTARKKWEALYKAAQDGTNPAKTFDAVQAFAGVAETMFVGWDAAEPGYDLPGYSYRDENGVWWPCNKTDDRSKT